MITAQTMLEKYEMRKQECEECFDEDVKELKVKDNSHDRIDWLHDDMKCLNAQIGVYECIIKDLKELLK
jgi:hypothetical protein